MFNYSTSIIEEHPDDDDNAHDQEEDKEGEAKDEDENGTAPHTYNLFFILEPDKLFDNLVKYLLKMLIHFASGH